MAIRYYDKRKCPEGYRDRCPLRGGFLECDDFKAEVCKAEYEAEAAKEEEDYIFHLISETVYYAHLAGYSLTEAEIDRRYREVGRQYGWDAALWALKNTLEAFKKRARQERSRMFARVKAECLERFGVTPANIRTLLVEVQQNPQAWDTPAVREFVARFDS